MSVRTGRRSGLLHAGRAVAGTGAALALGRTAAPARATAGLAAGSHLAIAPDDTGFGAAMRATLATDLLALFPIDGGLFIGRTVYLLPAAPWYQGLEPRAASRNWALRAPAGVPFYLMAAADPLGTLDPSLISVAVNGEPLAGLERYKRAHGPALFEDRSTGSPGYAILDLLLPPREGGALRVEVRVRYPAGATTAVPDDADGATRALLLPGPTETALTYDIAVAPPDSLSPLVLRDPASRLWALQGATRRVVPDGETFRALGYSDASVVSASAPLLAILPEGGTLPSLREGVPPTLASTDPIVRQSILPQLQEDLLLKGAAPDVYHVHRATLRKVPDWKWVVDKGLRPEDTQTLSDRVIALLPQNCPHWVLPGGTFQDASFHSDALGRRAPYRVYLPAGYVSAREAGARYPVLYLLHGKSARYDEWSGYGAEQVASELWYAGKLPPLIIVAPQGGVGYWMNQESGTAWGDYVARDLVTHVDATYRTTARREARAIGGLSMGGHGALQLALTFPSVFGAAGAHSPSLPQPPSAPAYFGVGSSFAQRDPLSLIKHATLPSPPRLWIDAGAKDPWRGRAEELRDAIIARGWEVNWHGYDGGHDGWYWGAHLWDYLPFYGDGFVRSGVSVPPRPTPPDW